GYTGDLAGEVPAGHELQGEEGVAVVLADFIDLHDVRVVQPGYRLGLQPEAVELLTAGVGPGEDHLQGHEPLELLLPGLVDDTHTAPAQLAKDFIARHGRRCECKRRDR